MNSKIKPAAIGGVFLGVLSQIPLINLLNCACCALVIGGGLLSSFLYYREAGSAGDPPYGDATILGLLTGAIGAVVGTIVSIPFAFIGGGFAAAMEQAMASMPSDVDIPPFLESAMVSGGVGFVGLVFSLFINLIIYSIFATIGTLIGTALFHGK